MKWKDRSEDNKGSIYLLIIITAFVVIWIGTFLLFF